MPAFGRLLLLVRCINAVTGVDAHLSHAIGRDDDGLPTVKGTRQLHTALLPMLRVEMAEQLASLATRSEPYAVNEILAACGVERFGGDANAKRARCFARQRLELPQRHRHLNVGVEEEVQILAV